jgi:hypothetical protein
MAGCSLRPTDNNTPAFTNWFSEGSSVSIFKDDKQLHEFALFLSKLDNSKSIMDIPEKYLSMSVMYIKEGCIFIEIPFNKISPSSKNTITNFVIVTRHNELTINYICTTE